MKLELKCKECGDICSNTRILIGHILSLHNLSSKEYYDKYLKKDNEGICLTCNKPTLYYKLSFGYKKYCEECNNNRCYSKLKCEICNTIIGGAGGGLGQHLKNKHNITSEEYYNDYIKEKEFEGKCKICNKPTKFLGINRGYNKYCSDKCSANDPELKERREQTNLERYGYYHNWASPELRENGQYKTNIEKYGTKFPQKLENIKLKKKETCIAKYGVDNYAKTDECWDKIKNTCLEQSCGKYTNTSQFPSNIDKSKQTVFNRLLLEKQEEYKNKVKIIGYKKRTLICECSICQNIFDILEETLKLRLSNNAVICTLCNPLNGKHISILEKELFNYIKSIYNGIIVENDRTALNGKEIDIYLPDLKIGFEFDGTYWHADPRFFEATDTIHGQIASEIWNNDKNKDELCESKQIQLIRIKEYDWNHNKDTIKQNLYVKLKT